MTTILREKLREFGFSEKEAAVYLALMEIGSAIASDIAKKSKLNRSTTYVILDMLTKRGLVSMVDRDGIQLYHAAPPEQLVQYLQSMAKQYAGLADTAKNLLPEFKSARKESAPAPKFQLFQGSEGIRSVYEDTLASLAEIRVHANFENMAHAAPATHANAKSGKRKEGAPDIKVQTMVLDTPEDRKRITPQKELLRKILLTSREKGGISSEMNIYDDRVVFISPSENFALIAESKEFASALKKMCDASQSHDAGALASAPAPAASKAKERAPAPDMLISPDGLAPAFG